MSQRKGQPEIQYPQRRTIRIVYTGLRPGEKLKESLFREDESFKRTVHEKILVAENGLLETAASGPQREWLDRLWMPWPPQQRLGKCRR